MSDSSAEREHGPDPLSGPSPETEHRAEQACLFVEDLERCVASLRRALAGGDHVVLRDLAERLAGAGRGAGLGDVRASARLLSGSLSEQAEIEAVREKVEALIRACRRARPG